MSGLLCRVTLWYSLTPSCQETLFSRAVTLTQGTYHHGIWQSKLRERGFVLCSLLGTQFITVRQHGVITQSMVVGICSLFVSWLTGKLEVEVMLLLLKAHYAPPSLSTPPASEVPQPLKTKPGPSVQTCEPMGTFRIQTLWPSCNAKCIQCNLWVPINLTVLALFKRPEGLPRLRQFCCELL